MAPSTEYAQEYQQALSAYSSGNYNEAAVIADLLVASHPEDANIRLLRGHIHICQSQFDSAREQYQTILEMTSDPELINCAHDGLADTDRRLQELSPATKSVNIEEVTAFQGGDTAVFQTDNADIPTAAASGLSGQEAENQEHDPKATVMDEPFPSFEDENFDLIDQDLIFDGMEEEATMLMNRALAKSDSSQELEAHASNVLEEFVVSPNATPLFNEPEDALFNNYLAEEENSENSPPLPTDLWFEEDSGEDSLFGDYASPTQAHNAQPPAGDDDFGLEEMDLLDASDDLTQFMQNRTSQGTQSTSQGQLETELFGKTDDYPTFEQDTLQDRTLASATFGIAATGFGSGNDLDRGAALDLGTEVSGYAANYQSPIGQGDMLADLSDPLVEEPAEIAPLNLHPSSATTLSSFTGPEAVPERIPSGGTLTSSSPWGKPHMTAAIATGVVSAIAAGVVSLGVAQQKDAAAAVLAGLAAGIAGAGTSFVMGQKNLSHAKRCTTDLQTQFGAVIRGDLTAKATEYSQDEFGQLAVSFNKMTRVIYALTSESQRKAEENEKSKEDLQRQVIRLLDDVEGAARGDLTVQAEVTADVLGAVADSFNLTIQNLQKIVQQVKVAAREVNNGATENESFARTLSADALRQAEELAVTLNSVQMMTNAIQRVAESAKEANQVAKEASASALKGGDAVEQTVKGILEIRETVAETTRKVKRLAESSQEISKIVGLISQIASRTNLLALNASIEAARAGESGRGFAVVADEVRQLADRAAKASKEIEQIVLQIQSETGSVMTAMEEGTQQVIEGTKLAEQAKRSLDEIIQVSSQIDGLVRSITNATVEQTETARSMAQVMQSVELTAQSTSQEAQRVSDSLQNLVRVARDLQGSVEKFKVES